MIESGQGIQEEIKLWSALKHLLLLQNLLDQLLLHFFLYVNNILMR